MENQNDVVKEINVTLSNMVIKLAKIESLLLQMADEQNQKGGQDE